MPTYEYECLKCGEKIEIFHGITEKPNVLCSKCGGNLRKVISLGSGIIFKGSGFYQTDYKKKVDYDKKKGLKDSDIKNSNLSGKCSCSE